MKAMKQIKKAACKAGLKVQKHSPEILVIAGIVGGVVSAVMACRASMKVGEIIDEAKNASDEIKRKEEETPEKFSDEEVNKERMAVVVQTGVKVVRLYGPSVGLGALSITSILTGHHILNKRHLALVGAFTALESDFKDYRGRVRSKWGEEIEKELRYGIQEKQCQETIVGEDGSELTVPKTVKVADPNLRSAYARYFDNASSEYSGNIDYDMMFLKAQERYANDLLRSKGRLFLNELLEMLGYRADTFTQKGQKIGWVFDEEHPLGDNYVDFGIQVVNQETENGGYKPIIVLDFNVDGYILDRMPA